MARNLNNTSGALSDLAKGNTSVVTVTGRDAFTAGDPVFLDYQLNQIVARNTANATEALAAGSFGTVLIHPYQVNPSSTGGGTAVFGDGSFVVINSTQCTAASADNRQRIMMSLFDKQGSLLNTQYNFVGSALTAPDFAVLVASVSATTAAYSYRVNGGTSGVAIIDKNLNVVAQTAIANWSIGSLTATSDGLLIISNLGVHKLSLAGVVTQLVSISVGFIGENCTDGADIKERYVTNWTGPYAVSHRKDMFPISSGGFGTFLVTGPSTTLTYYSFNSDGTLRNFATVASGLFTVSIASTAVGASGNIFWSLCSTTGTTWGIVSDNGTVVKAATLAGGDPSTGSYWPNTTCITDANGDFIFTWSSGGGATLNTNYVVGTTGTSKSGFPRTDSISTSSTVCRLYRLSTGILNYMTSSAASYRGTWWLVNNAGTMLKTAQPSYPLGVGTYAFANMLAGTVFNDTLYLSYANSVGTSTTDWVGMVQRIDNAGNSSIVGQSGTYPTDVMPIVYVDANDIKVYSGNYVSRYRTSDLKYLGQNFQGWTTLYPAGNARFCVVKSGQQYVMTHSLGQGGVSNSWQATGIPWATATISAGERTVVLGVAVSNSTAGGPVMVQTKGTAPCNWTNTRLAFDQSAATPPGNTGEVIGNVITLKGIAGA